MIVQPTKNQELMHPADVIVDFKPNELHGLRVTFINMPLRETAEPNVPPEGPGLLAAVLQQYGAIPSIIDLNAYRIKDKAAQTKGLTNGRHLTYKEVEDLLTTHFDKLGDQDVVGFSGMITTLRWQEEMAKMVRRLQPDCFLVTGNGLATEIKTGLFSWIPELDAIAHSEGDDVILAIARDAKRIKEKGIKRAIGSNSLSPYYIGEIAGRHRFMYGGNRPRNLGELPFAAWDLLECDPYGDNLLEKYINVPVWGAAANNSSATSFTMARSLSTVSSRGCPYACAFCYRGSQGERNYGMRPAEHLAKQMREYIDDYDIDFIGFVDDNFAVDARRINQLPQVFSDYGVQIKWGTHTRMDEADERAYAMAEAGCVYIGFGAESASGEILERMSKGGFILKNGLISKKIDGRMHDFPRTMVDSMENCVKAGIHANCTWIMGYPGESLDHLKTSVAFIMWQQELLTRNLPHGTEQYQLAIDAVNKRMFTATAYPGTAMFRDPEVRGILTENFDIAFDSLNEPICDDAFHDYVLELDDATKVLHNKEGDPLNFSAMSMDTFLQAREYIDNGETEKILEM